MISGNYTLGKTKIKNGINLEEKKKTNSKHLIKNKSYKLEFSLIVVKNTV